MIRIVSLTDDHIQALDLQDEQRRFAPDEMMAIAQAQAGYGPSWAAVDGDYVLAIGGMCVCWPTRAVCWAGLSRHVGRRMVALTRVVRALMDAQPFTRLEMYVAAESANGCRWARLLGFTNETPTPMRAFLPDGSAAYLYARTR